MYMYSFPLPAVSFPVPAVSFPVPAVSFPVPAVLFPVPAVPEESSHPTTTSTVEAEHLVPYYK